VSLDYWAKALECEERAEETADQDVREFFHRLRDSWIRAANHRQILEGAEIMIPGLSQLDTLR
jgi:hypothetical protein